jgi:hypothetical protein
MAARGASGKLGKAADECNKSPRELIKVWYLGAGDGWLALQSKPLTPTVASDGQICPSTGDFNFSKNPSFLPVKVTPALRKLPHMMQNERYEEYQRTRYPVAKICSPIDVLLSLVILFYFCE